MFQKILVLFFVPIVLFAQDFLPRNSFGEFKEAVRFDINPSSGIFVIDGNEILKIDTLGNVDKTAGGYGWSDGVFDEASDIFANALQVIVADKNNDRIQIFDRDLNFLSVFKTHEYEDENYSFRYPDAVAVSGLGDLYILDSENKRILKYNLNGDFLLQIGAYDAGEYQLNSPVDFVTDARGNIYVAENNMIVLYDQYGTGLRKINLDFSPEKLQIYDKGIIAINDQSVLFIDLMENKKFMKKFPGSPITDIKLTGNTLYVLTAEKITRYTVTK